MKKLILVFVCVTLIIPVFGARKKSKIIDTIYMCKNRHKFTVEQVNKARNYNYNIRPICPICKKILYAYPVQH